MAIRKTPLNAIHHEMGARMVDFAGWEMPVQYHSALEEHHAVRRSVGVFDVSHMGQIEITGPGALAFTQALSCNNVGRLADGQAQYSAFLTESGTFVDDIVVYRFGPERIFICVNAATTAKDFEWVMRHPREDVRIENRSDEFAQIAVQGPASSEVLQPLTETDLSSIRFYWFREGSVAGHPAIISRTGYTGEAGFELYVSPEAAPGIWRALFETGRPFGIAPAGLAARNTLRLEMRYPLYGTDIDESTTPLEAGLAWIVKGSGFTGEIALNRQKLEGLKRRLTGLELVEPGVIRDGFPVLAGGSQVATVTSGGFAPSLAKSIAMAYLPSDLSAPGSELEIDIRGKRRRAVVVATPFYHPDKG